jgi:hypothetical protein
VIDLAAQDAVTVVWGADKETSSTICRCWPAATSTAMGWMICSSAPVLATGRTTRASDSGEAYIVFGSESLPEEADLAHGQEDVTIYGASGQSVRSQSGDQMASPASWPM